ncbi:MAG: ribonuclease HI family protein [Thermoplasmata archaeon]|nr:ribonuclease HI family protein [Thermoplasmata archaeon]
MDEQLPRATVVTNLPVRVHFDGACEPARGGGVATYGFTVEGEEMDHEEFGLAVPPGSERATNNVAEYVAAVRALEYLLSRGYTGVVVVVGDSQLVVRQMSGEYEVKAEHLRAYHEHLGALADRLGEVRFEWVPREENTRADALSKLALTEARQDAHRRKVAERRPPAPLPGIPELPGPDPSGP